MAISKIVILTIIFLVLMSVVSASDSTGVSITVKTLSLPPLNNGGSTSGSSGGSGGSGIVSDEPSSNVASHCSEDKDLYFGHSTTYSFKCTIYEIVIDGTQNEPSITGRVDELKGISSKTPTQPDGEVYKFVNAYIGTKRFEGAELRFKVPLSFSGDNVKTIYMFAWKDGAWKQLPILQINKDTEYTYFGAKTDHFSNFVIVGKNVVSEPNTVTTPALIVPTPTETPNITPSSTEAPKFDMKRTLLLLFVFLVIVVGSLIYVSRKKQ